MVVTLDPAQLVRIEATHSGFLYQHLFAVAQLLTLQDAVSLRIETDEDVEVLTETEHLYTQVKHLKAVLQPSDIQEILSRFAALRAEHETGHRIRKCSFAIFSSSEPSASLAKARKKSDWPSDVEIVSPKGKQELYRVPAWTTLEDAIDWTTKAAEALPYCRLAPATLVWKLAAHVHVIATGRVYSQSHEILLTDRRALFEQIDLFTQMIPPPPDRYRAQDSEPALLGEERVRVIVGGTGSGKSSWFSMVSQHFSEKLAFMRASSDIENVASWIVRSLVAHLSSSDTLAAVFRPGAVATESLGLLDQLSEQKPLLVVIDNAHLLEPLSLAQLIQASHHLRWLMMGQPGPVLSELLARLSIKGEQLGGWSIRTIAEELAFHEIAANAELSVRVRQVTEGLPLFVQSTAEIAKTDYEGDLARFLDEFERGVHSAEMPQERILAVDVIAHLSEDSRKLAALLSAVRSDLPIEIVHHIGGELLALTSQQSLSLVRTLSNWRVLRPGLAKMVGVHDAFRPALQAEFLKLDHEVRENGLCLLLDSIKDQRSNDGWSVEAFLDRLRLLVSLGDGKTVVDVVYGAVEILHEYGAIREVEVLLTEVFSIKDLSDEFTFLAADALAFMASQAGKIEDCAKWVDLCETIAKRQTVVSPDWEARIAIKRILMAGHQGDFVTAKQLLNGYLQWAARGTEGFRVTLYDFALAAHKAEEFTETIKVVTELIDDYFAIFGVSPDSLFGKNPEQLKVELNYDGREDELRHLANCLHLRGMAAVDSGRFPGVDFSSAMKLYELLGSYSSAIKSGVEWANATRQAGNLEASLKLFEETIVPNVENNRMMESIVSVYMNYANALAEAGRFGEAQSRLDAAAVFVPGLPDSDQELFSRVASGVAQLESWIKEVLPERTNGVTRIDRQEFDSEEMAVAIRSLKWMKTTFGT